MLKKLTIFIFGTFLFFSFSKVTFAKTVPVVKATETYMAKTTPTPTPQPTPYDSFANFWPMSAGKTMQSKIYFLKTLKEKIRGMLIFGSAQKADYDVFLGIKRMLEAETLMKGNVPDLANKTLDSANSNLDKANDALINAKNSSDIDQDTKNEINTRLTNLKAFTNSLIIQYPDYKDKLQVIFEKLNSLTV
ncbi:hypothetical protein BH10PAT1_BH10PAT1_6050 [soil metagenome]